MRTQYQYKKNEYFTGYTGHVMERAEKREFWLRGPIPGVAPLLQPVAHAILQSRLETTEIITSFPEELLWIRPAGLASVGFHLQHLAGVLDRLFTYAEGRALNENQLQELTGEGRPRPGMDTVAPLLYCFDNQVNNVLQRLTHFSEVNLTDGRLVGRAQLPSTVGGLLFHAAEHTQRHTGQLLVTAKVLLGGFGGNPPGLKGV